MWTKFNREQNGTEIYFESAQQTPSAIVFDTDFLEQLERIEKESCIWDIVDDLEAAREDADSFEMQACEAYADADSWEELYNEREDTIVELEDEIDYLQRVVKELRREQKER